MKILAITLSYALAFMVGAVVSAALCRMKRRKARERRGTFIKSRDRALNLTRDMEQSVVRITRSMKRAGVAGVTVFHSPECAAACGGKYVPKGEKPL